MVNPRSCTNIDKEVVEGDVVEVIGYCKFKAMLTTRVRINGKIKTYLAS